jgi:transposase-like protein
MEYRLIDYTYRQIAEQMEVAPSIAYKWVWAGLADITQETAEELRRVTFEQYHQIMQELMPAGRRDFAWGSCRIHIKVLGIRPSR